MIKKYWSCEPGKYVNLNSGQEINFKAHGISFSYNQSEWNIFLYETIRDLALEVAGISDAKEPIECKVYANKTILELLNFTDSPGKENLVEVGYKEKYYFDSNLKSNLIQVRVGSKNGIIEVLDL
jgi:hypothetical protein